MTEQLLFDLMGDLDVSFLENDYIERDLINQKRAMKRVLRKKTLKKGTEFTLTDSLRNAVYEQRELIDTVVAPSIGEETIGERIDLRMKAVKKKVNKAVTIISGIVAMAVLAISVILVLVKKKSIAKMFSKRVKIA